MDFSRLPDRALNRQIIGCLLLGGLLTLPGQALAQWYDYGANVDIMIKNQYVMAMDSNLLTMRNLEKKRQQKRAGTTWIPAAAVAPVALSFAASEQVATDTRESYLTHLAKEDPKSAREYREVLETQDVRGNFRANLAAYGLNADNVGDVLSAYWVVLWAIANKERTDALSVSAIGAVGNAVRKEMQTDPTMRGITDAERQAVADMMMYDTVLADGSYQNAMRARRQDQIDLLSDAVQDRILEQGLDLRAIKLTRNGFKKR